MMARRKDADAGGIAGRSFERKTLVAGKMGEAAVFFGPGFEEPIGIVQDFFETVAFDAQVDFAGKGAVENVAPEGAEREGGGGLAGEGAVVAGVGLCGTDGSE